MPHVEFPICVFTDTIMYTFVENLGYMHVVSMVLLINTSLVKVFLRYMCVLVLQLLNMYESLH